MLHNPVPPFSLYHIPTSQILFSKYFAKCLPKLREHVVYMKQ